MMLNADNKELIYNPIFVTRAKIKVNFAELVPSIPSKRVLLPHFFAFFSNAA